MELPGPGGSWHPGRLLLMRRPAGSAAKSRARIDQKARKRGGTATLKQQRAADWLVLLTTLAAAEWPAPRVMALYRLRWQIELAFKRLKSQLRLAELQAKDPRLARACILAKLILALLVHRLVDGHRRPFSPRTGARSPPSLWRLTRLVLLSLLAALLGTCRPGTWHARQRPFERLLAEPPRRRSRQLGRCQELLT